MGEKCETLYFWGMGVVRSISLSEGSHARPTRPFDKDRITMKMLGRGK
jgi:hypothetical protein